MFAAGIQKNVVLYLVVNHNLLDNSCLKKEDVDLISVVSSLSKKFFAMSDEWALLACKKIGCDFDFNHGFLKKLKIYFNCQYFEFVKEISLRCANGFFEDLKRLQWIEGLLYHESCDVVRVLGSYMQIARTVYNNDEDIFIELYSVFSQCNSASPEENIEKACAELKLLTELHEKTVSVSDNSFAFFEHFPPKIHLYKNPVVKLKITKKKSYEIVPFYNAKVKSLFVSGALPFGIERLTHLKKLDCQFFSEKEQPITKKNIFVLEPIEKSIALLKNLQELRISSLTDKDILQLPRSLTSLSVAKGKCSYGTISHLFKLKHLKIIKNDCFHAINFTAISQLRLISLDIKKCFLKEIPAQIANIRTLEKLFLRNNEIETIPQEISQLNLLELSLQSNFIRRIPDFIFNLPLTKIVLSNNPLEHKVKFLDISYSLPGEKARKILIKKLKNIDEKMASLFEANQKELSSIILTPFQEQKEGIFTSSQEEKLHLKLSFFFQRCKVMHLMVNYLDAIKKELSSVGASLPSQLRQKAKRVATFSKKIGEQNKAYKQAGVSFKEAYALFAENIRKINSEIDDIDMKAIDFQDFLNPSEIEHFLCDLESMKNNLVNRKKELYEDFKKEKKLFDDSYFALFFEPFFEPFADVLNTSTLKTLTSMALSLHEDGYFQKESGNSKKRNAPYAVEDLAVKRFKK